MEGKKVEKLGNEISENNKASLIIHFALIIPVFMVFDTLGLDNTRISSVVLVIFFLLYAACGFILLKPNDRLSFLSVLAPSALLLGLFIAACIANFGFAPILGSSAEEPNIFVLLFTFPYAFINPLWEAVEKFNPVYATSGYFDVEYPIRNLRFEYFAMFISSLIPSSSLLVGLSIRKLVDKFKQESESAKYHIDSSVRKDEEPIPVDELLSDDS